MQQSVKERLCILYQHTTDTGTAPCPRETHTLTVARGSTHTCGKARGKETERDSRGEGRTGADTQSSGQTDRERKKARVSEACINTHTESV